MWVFSRAGAMSDERWIAQLYDGPGCKLGESRDVRVGAADSENPPNHVIVPCRDPGSTIGYGKLKYGLFYTDSEARVAKYTLEHKDLAR